EQGLGFTGMNSATGIAQLVQEIAIQVGAQQCADQQANDQDDGEGTGGGSTDVAQQTTDVRGDGYAGAVAGATVGVVSALAVGGAFGYRKYRQNQMKKDEELKSLMDQDGQQEGESNIERDAIEHVTVE